MRRAPLAGRRLPGLGAPQSRAIAIDNWWITFCLIFGSTITGLILYVSYRKFLSDTYRLASMAATFALLGGGTFGGWTMLNFLIAIPSQLNDSQCNDLSHMRVCPSEKEGWLAEADHPSTECCKMAAPRRQSRAAAGSRGEGEAVAPILALPPRTHPRFKTRTLEFCTPCGFTKGCETTMDDVCVCTLVIRDPNSVR